MSTLQDRPAVPDRKASPDSAPAVQYPTTELVNTITHGIGLVLSIAGAVVLIDSALSRGDVWRVVGCSIFAITLVAVYAASTLSHGFSRPQLRRLFRMLDQGFIYLLIAGTYTPFALVYLRTGWWWLLFGAMWTIALCGFCSKILFSHRVEAVAVWSYLLLGWLPILSASSLIEVVPTDALRWMLTGGLCYTVGAVFLISDLERFHFHAIWHTFVMAGSTWHFLAIFFFVANTPIHGI